MPSHRRAAHELHGRHLQHGREPHVPTVPTWLLFFVGKVHGVCAVSQRIAVPQRLCGSHSVPRGFVLYRPVGQLYALRPGDGCRLQQHIVRVVPRGVGVRTKCVPTCSVCRGNVRATKVDVVSEVCRGKLFSGWRELVSSVPGTVLPCPVCVCVCVCMLACVCVCVC